MKILIIDNYDSFTYNLYQYVGELIQSKLSQFSLEVIRNDEKTIEEIKHQNYDRIIISPGPGSPDDTKYFGVCGSVLADIGKSIPVLGVCLGMQGMAYVFGGSVIRAQRIVHGKTSHILHDSKGLFARLPQYIEVMRYHSLVADPYTLPNDLIITAIVQTQPIVHTDIRDIAPEKKQFESLNPSMLKRTVERDEVEIMGLRHKTYPVEGIQFHPESFATEGGKELLGNFLFK